MKRPSRWTLGAVAIVLAFALGAFAPAAAQATRPPSGFTSWSDWLADIANVSRLIEIGAFVFAAYQFWAGRHERREADEAAAERARIDSNYQAWQVINSAQGKGGSGGRIEALSDLLRNNVSLAGIRLDDAWLEGVRLAGATMVRSSLRRANFARANLARANLEEADLSDGDFIACNLAGANLRGANLTGARLSAATLDGADLREVVGWREIRSLSHASIVDVHGAPPGFLELARAMGAVDANTPVVSETDEERSFSRELRAT